MEDKIKECKNYCEASFYNQEGECSKGYAKKMCKDVAHCVFKQLLAEQAKNKKLVEALEKISNIDNICSGCEFKIDSYCRASKSQEINYLKDQEKCLKNVNYYNDKIITLAQQALNEVNKC